MRAFLATLCLLFLAACGDSPTRQLNCDTFDYGSMSEQQKPHAVAYCNAEMKRQAEKTMSARFAREAKSVNMPLDEYLQSRMGLVMMIKELSAVAVGLVLVIAGWIAALVLVRLTTWEEQEATRRKWGPFSYWEITYRRRKSEFMDMAPLGWLLTISIVGGIVSIAVYATIAN